MTWPKCNGIVYVCTWSSLVSCYALCFQDPLLQAWFNAYLLLPFVCDFILCSPLLLFGSYVNEHFCLQDGNLDT